jgi:hypothetical protein
MTPAFVDRSFLLALVLADDELHARAVGWQTVKVGPLVTSEYVLVEFADALAAEPLRAVAIATIALLRSDRTVTVVPASTSLLDEGLTLFAGRADKRWSLTDRLSFRVTGLHGLTEALTADHHFEQAGFRPLLRYEPPLQ